MALLLRRRGITRIRPLAGGLESWRQHGYPLADYGNEAAAAKSR